MLRQALFVIIILITVPFIIPQPTVSKSPDAKFSPTPPIQFKKSPTSKTLHNDYHIFQSFNNCGPASLSMTLSYFGINESQESLGEALRPYQDPSGENDDKSVTLKELAKKSQEYGVLAYHRQNGNVDLIKNFINYDIPVIVRTWLATDDDIGHYRIIKGYNDETQEFIQDDSYQGKNLPYTYEHFNELWEKFNYEYLVLIPKEKKHIAERIIGEDMDIQKAWQKAATTARQNLKEDTNDVYARFNLSIALYHLKQYEEAIAEFEKVENQLPPRTLWYQIEPILAYFQMKNYDKVFSLTDNILSGDNQAFSELYLIRSKMYIKKGNIALAKEEFEKAVLYNKNLIETQQTFNTFLEQVAIAQEEPEKILFTKLIISPKLTPQNKDEISIDLFLPSYLTNN